MKGIFIHKQLEFRLEVSGDEFYQGDSLPCTFSVKNHGTSSQSVSDIFLDLVTAKIGKVKDRTDGAHEKVGSATLEALGDIEPQQQKSCTWIFDLDKNCSITDKAQSLFLIFGSASLEASYELLVTVQPQRHIKQVLGILESAFQFVLRGEKSNDGWVQAKFKPPTARRFSLVEELNLGCRFDGNALLLKYLFKVKRFGASQSSVSVKKAKTEVEQRLEVSEYMLTGTHINHKALEAKIEEALETVATGL